MGFFNVFYSLIKPIFQFTDFLCVNLNFPVILTHHILYESSI